MTPLKTILCWVFISLWLIDCSPKKTRDPRRETRDSIKKDSLKKITQQEPRKQTKKKSQKEYEAMLDSIPADVWGDREQVSGDFDGDDRQETLTERYVNCKTGEEIAQSTSHKFGDYFVYQQWVGRRCPICYLEDKAGKLAELRPLKNATSQVGFSFVENIGDVDGQPGDEIAFAISYIAMTMRGDCQIWTYKQKAWKKLATVNFHYQTIQHPDHPGKPYLFKDSITDKYGILYRRKLNGRVKYVDPMGSGLGWVDLLTRESWDFDMRTGPEGENERK